MFFKNLQAYRLTADIAESASALSEQLAKRAFVPCGNQDIETRGWVAPNPHDFKLEDASFVHAVGDHWLLCLQTETKILPQKVVDEVAAERATEIEQTQGYKLGRKQMKELKELVASELLPRAFTTKRKTFAWIDTKNRTLAIDAASSAKAEEVLEVLRHTLDELPLALLRTEHSPMSAMADWLAGGEAPAGFTIDQECELQSVSEDKASVRYQRHALDGGDVKDHLSAGKLPTRLALTFEERVSFVLTEKLELKRIDLLDVVKESLDAEQHDDAAALFDAQLALSAGELSRMIAAVIEALGGELKGTDSEGGETDAPVMSMSQSGLSKAVDKFAEAATKGGASVTISTGNGEHIFSFGNENDPLYPQAKQAVKQSGRPSISLVQRELRIGYNRAASLIEQMERDGLVSPLASNGQRTVIEAGAAW